MNFRLVSAIKVPLKSPNKLQNMSLRYSTRNGFQGVVEPKYKLDTTVNPIDIEGIINFGPANSNYGIGLSHNLMKRLGLKNGDIFCPPMRF